MRKSMIVVSSLAVLLLTVSPATPQTPGNMGAPRAEEVQASVPEAASPEANTTVGSARIIVPDGTSYSDTFSDGATQWFVARVEAAKSYVVEVLDSDDDNGSNGLGVALFEADGTTAFAAFNDCTATLNETAPALDVNGGSDGVRCSFGYITTPNSKNVTIRVTQSAANSFHIRLRETTIYSRWTVNGYDMYVAVSNPSSFPTSGFALYYPDAPASPTGYLTYSNVQLAALNSTQIKLNSGSLSPNHGQLRMLMIYGGGGGVDFYLQTYAYNTGPGTYLFFTPEKMNHQGGNSW